MTEKKGKKTTRLSKLEQLAYSAQVVREYTVTTQNLTFEINAGYGRISLSFSQLVADYKNKASSDSKKKR